MVGSVVNLALSAGFVRDESLVNHLLQHGIDRACTRTPGSLSPALDVLEDFVTVRWSLGNLVQCVVHQQSARSSMRALQEYQPAVCLMVLGGFANHVPLCVEY